MTSETAENRIYLLVHERVIGTGRYDRDSKILGYFSSEDEARLVIESARRLEGFSQAPDGFRIVAVPLDMTRTSGFLEVVDY